MFSFFQLDDRKKIGLGLTAFGVFFIILGIILFFDKGLIAIGNILFLCGITVTIGPMPTVKFFTRRRNIRGSIFFLGGFILVIVSWTMVGMACQLYGSWFLFKGFIPYILQYLRQIPYLGQVLDNPTVKSVLNRITPAQSLPITRQDKPQRVINPYVQQAPVARNGNRYTNGYSYTTPSTSKVQY